MTPIVPYISVVDAQTYFDGRLGTDAWDDASSIDRTKALSDATMRIDRLNFIGQKADSLQMNQFPRGMDVSVPNDIQCACAELALALLDGVDPNLEIKNVAALQQHYATTRTSYDRDFVLAHVRAGIPSSEAWEFLLPYLVDPFSVRLRKRV